MHYATRVRRGLTGVFAGCLALPLAGCFGSGSGLDLGTAVPQPTETAAVASASASPTIGNGPVRVALLLPLTGSSQGAAAATSLRNAADMAMAEFQNPDLTILVKDDRGTPDGAREATREAMAEGAELVIGPLFASSVQSAGQVARQAGKPVIAFSTDASVAANGVYLLSFLAQSEVDRIVDYAAAQGRRSLAALIPETVYGNVVEAQLREAAARRGIRVVARGALPGRAAAGRRQPHRAAHHGRRPGRCPFPARWRRRSRGGRAGARPGRVQPATGQAARHGGVERPARVPGEGPAGRLVRGPRRQRLRRLRGALPQPASAAIRRASPRLSYDAVSLAAALARTQGSQRFSETVLTNRSGFAGADGVFRFRQDGTNERALAVLEVRGSAAVTVSPAPKNLGQAT